VFATDRTVKLLTLGACCFGLFMVMLDNTIVNVALPSIQRELGAGVSGLQLVVDAYVLVFASLLLTAGSLGDRFGRRRVFRAGLVVFTASSALCGLAPTLPALVGGRALQAVGGAALLPSTLAILTTAFPDPRERCRRSACGRGCRRWRWPPARCWAGCSPTRSAGAGCSTSTCRSAWRRSWWPGG
jgi:MFS family permease